MHPGSVLSFRCVFFFCSFDSMLASYKFIASLISALYKDIDEQIKSWLRRKWSGYSKLTPNIHRLLIMCCKTFSETGEESEHRKQSGVLVESVVWALV
jgi:hypothetical protein